MNEHKVLNALINLIDDPDREVFDTVSSQIINYGKSVIPKLESVWENTTDKIIQERIENIIHKVHFNNTLAEMRMWYSSQKPILLNGLFIVAGYRYQQLSEDSVRKTIKNIYQSCWLELNNYLTPLEQVNIINSIFYSMYKFKGFDLEDHKPSHFYINDVIESRTGNPYSLGLLYQVICEMLDIPVYMIHLPRQTLLAYFDTVHDYLKIRIETKRKIQFYIDPINGFIYTQNDVDAYLKKYNFETDENTYSPLSNKELITHYLQAMYYTYKELKQVDYAQEIKLLYSLRDEYLD